MIIRNFFFNSLGNVLPCQHRTADFKEVETDAHTHCSNRIFFWKHNSVPDSPFCYFFSLILRTYKVFSWKLYSNPILRCACSIHRVKVGFQLDSLVNGQLYSFFCIWSSWNQLRFKIFNTWTRQFWAVLSYNKFWLFKAKFMKSDAFIVFIKM